MQQKFVGWCNQENMLRRLDLEESMPITLAGGWQMQYQLLMPVFAFIGGNLTSVLHREQTPMYRCMGLMGVAKVLHASVVYIKMLVWWQGTTAWCISLTGLDRC